MDPSTHRNLFPIPHLCVLTLVPQKVHIVYGHSTYWMTVLLSKMSVFELDARYDWWVMALNTHWSFFPISHLCVLICLTWKVQVIYGCLNIKWLFSYWRHSLCGLQLQERFNSRATAPGMHQLFSDTKLCACTASPYILLFDAQRHMTTTLTYLMMAYYTPNNNFNANDALFHKSKVG